MADPIHQFVITPIFEDHFTGFNLAFTNSSLWMAISAVTAIVFLMLAIRKKELVPGRLQAVAEMMYRFMASMVHDNIGSKGHQYFPLVFTLFVIVLMGNVLGLLPYSFTFTSHLIVTFALAFSVFLVVSIFGFVNHGIGFLRMFVPPKVPLVLLILIVPIEVLSFIIRPVTLAMRLFANMLAGHLMLKVFAGFSVMMAGMGTVGIFSGLIPMGFNVALLLLELLVAALQAYIFAILSCIYLKDTIDLHH